MLQNFIKTKKPKPFSKSKPLTLLTLSTAIFLGSCTQVMSPDTRNVNIPSPTFAEERKPAINERPDAVMYVPLGEDVLVPEASLSDPFPRKIVGPFELRGETLGGALQLILDGMDIPIAFESPEGLERTITIANLKGELETVVSRVCGLADLYCAYEDGILVVKETQLFTITIPPLGEADDFLTNVSGAIEEIVGSSPITDSSTRTIVYRASQRTSEIAESYFQRLRSNTALIVFETYIWEVSLNSGNAAGIRWESIQSIGKFNTNISINSPNADIASPISIGIPTEGVPSADEVFTFISEYGTVKTISQPQVTVLSGSSARFRVADTQNFVSEITRSVDEGVESVSTTTDSVDTGFTFDISSNWDNSTVYGNIEILLQEVRQIDTFDDNPDAIVQLPQTTERELSTQVRIRPGDSLLIGGLVREIDNFSKDGPGFQEPLFPTSQTAQTQNVELVFLLRPRVIVYGPPSKEHMDDLKQRAIDMLPPIPVTPTKPTIVDDVIKEMAPVVKSSEKTVSPVENTITTEDVQETQPDTMPVEIIEKQVIPDMVKPEIEEKTEGGEDAQYVPAIPLF